MKTTAITGTHWTARRACRPLFRWQGGKQHLRNSIVAMFPTRVERYFEPFMGAGSVYLAVRHAGFRGPALLGDFNPDLVEAHRTVACDPAGFEAAYRVHVERHCRDYFYELRNSNASGWTPAERAARTVYLCKAAFHGLYRVNGEGKVISTYGTGELSRIRLGDEHIRTVSKALHDATIRHGDFGWIVDEARAGDLVFLDPPYFGGNCAYTAEGFGELEHLRLRQTCDILNARGVFFVQTNANRPFVRELYRDYRLLGVPPAPAIGCGSSGRQPVGEIFIANFEPGSRAVDCASQAYVRVHAEK